MLHSKAPQSENHGGYFAISPGGPMINASPFPNSGLRGRVSSKLQELGSSFEEHRKDLLSRVSEELPLGLNGRGMPAERGGTN